jgi:hypothetical protein
MFGRTKMTDGEGGKSYKTVLRQNDNGWAVQGSFAYEEAVRKAKHRYRRGLAVGVLVPVTEGKYQGAVSACINGMQLGSLPHNVSADFYPLVLQLQKKHKRATVLLDFADAGGYRAELAVGVLADPALADYLLPLPPSPP